MIFRCKIICFEADDSGKMEMESYLIPLQSSIGWLNCGSIQLNITIVLYSWNSVSSRLGMIVHSAINTVAILQCSESMSFLSVLNTNLRGFKLYKSIHAKHI